MLNIQFEYYVINYNSNKNRIEQFNIFSNSIVQEYTEKAIKKYLRSPKKFRYESFCNGQETLYGFDALVREIEGIIQWQEWGRIQYEISCGYAFETDCNKLEKIDCYYQCKKNIPMIVREVIWQYKQRLKERTENCERR